MNIGVVQIDGKLPNLALMKIAGYHESIGDRVEWYKGSLFNQEYDKVYASKLFSFSATPELPENAMIGGTGIDFSNKLPAEIENANINISYSLYPNFNYHIGFSMKGCRFRCPFCCVPQKEGRPHIYNSIDEILINPKGKNRLMLLDNDFFGTKNWKANLERIIELKLKVCFVQGLNIRIITQEQADLLAKCNFTNSHFNQKYLTFAWDKFKDEKLILKGIEICNNAGIKNRQMQFFVLIGYDTSEQEDLYRINFLKKLNCLPFAMPYDKNDEYQKALCGYVNKRSVFYSCDWENYKYTFSKDTKVLKVQ